MSDLPKAQIMKKQGPEDHLLAQDELMTAEALLLSRLFFQIRDRRERLRIVALAESVLKLQASRETEPDAPLR
jgi:hypothetical protein